MASSSKHGGVSEITRKNSITGSIQKRRATFETEINRNNNNNNNAVKVLSFVAVTVPTLQFRYLCNWRPLFPFSRRLTFHTSLCVSGSVHSTNMLSAFIVAGADFYQKMAGVLSTLKILLFFFVVKQRVFCGFLKKKVFCCVPRFVLFF